MSSSVMLTNRPEARPAFLSSVSAIFLVSTPAVWSPATFCASAVAMVALSVSDGCHSGRNSKAKSVRERLAPERAREDPEDGIVGGTEIVVLKRAHRVVIRPQIGLAR